MALLVALTFVIGFAGPGVNAYAGASHGSHATKQAKKKAKKKAAKKKVKAKKKSKAKKKKTTSKPASAAPTAAECKRTSAAISTAGAAFMAHVRSAHLEKSPGDQVADFANPDPYVKLHTIWLESVIDPVAAALTGPALKAFMAHVKSAHLEKSPFEQLTDLSDFDAYVKLHTIWLQSVLAPLLEDSGCESTSSPPSGGGGGAAPGSGAVMIMDYTYSPANLTVAPGSKVTWMNMDSDAHTVTSTDGGGLSSSNMGKNQEYSFTFSSPGSYQYFCAIHPQMKGAVTVQ